MGQTVQIGKLADAVMETLEEYADLAAEDVKQAVRDAGETVREEIRANARKGKHRIRPLFVTCFRGVITFRQTGRSITGSARRGWNYIRIRKI